MTSTFTWLAHSDAERRKMLDAIDSFKESDTRDELGLGTIRDGFADLLFPGTSVVQTRARYFLFVPWMYAELEARKIRSADVESRARKIETSLITALKASDEPTGTIGARAGDAIKRLPSNVYWLGLGAWKIRLLDASQDDYHRSLDRFYAQASGAQRDDDDELVAGRLRRNWDPGLPPAPPDFPKMASFKLTREEARYLSERVQLAAGRSLLAFLCAQGRPTDVPFIWQHPQAGAFPAHIQQTIAHARLLAETMHGAAWLYNVMLAEERQKASGDGEPVKLFRERLSAWASELEARREAIASWDRQAFWAMARSLATVTRPTEAFVESWLRLAPWERVDGGADLSAARDLIRRREQQLKRPRARLSNPRALEIWGGASATSRLEYRWRTTQRLLADIYEGLGKGGAHA